MVAGFVIRGPRVAPRLLMRGQGQSRPIIIHSHCWQPTSGRRGGRGRALHGKTGIKRLGQVKKGRPESAGEMIRARK